MKFTLTIQVRGAIFLRGGYTENKMGTSCLGPCRSSLVVSHLRTPILNCFNYLLWAYVSSDSELSCLAMLPKPYPVSGPIYLPLIPNQLHCMSKCGHEVLRTILGSRLMPIFTYKISCFVLS